MDDYPNFAFDADDYPFFVFEICKLPFPIKSAEDAAKLVKRLLEEDMDKSFPVDPRFVRLGKLLEQRLPDEEGNLWSLKPNDDLPRRSRIWQPMLQGADKMKKLLPVLFPLARELRLGCFDAMFGIYIPPDMMTKPIPLEEGIQYRAEFDQEFSSYLENIRAGNGGKTKRWSEESVKQYMDEHLAPRLAQQGFTPYPQDLRRFQRIISGGYQNRR
jgi:hypothetical protein